MNCEEFEALLDDFVDGALSETKRRAAVAHRNGCPACRAAEARMSAVLAKVASLPRGLEPGRDLWPGVAARLGERNVLRRAVGGARRFGWPRLGALAAAAAVLVAVSSVVTAVFLAGRAPAPGRFEVASGVTSASLHLDQARGTYEAARAQLLAALAARRGSQSPATLKVIKDNNALMERALAHDPGNQELPALLVTAYRQEIDLLQRAAQIPARG